MSSYAFHPSVGGIETASEMLAGEFARSGHEVRVVTHSEGTGRDRWPFRVIRRPRLRELWLLCRWADVVFQNNLSIRLLWPSFIAAKPCVVTTQTWLSGSLRLETRFSRFKRLLLRKCRNVAISDAIARHIGLPCEILGNPYDEQTFRCLPDVERKSELLFVGRLVSDKGLDLLLSALARLRDTGLRPELTVVGDGPERRYSEELVRELQLGDQVKFTGIVQGMELARLMNAHRILVVPSRWAEPFGIVALEGIACGCVVVASEAGGLKEAVGACGLTVPNDSEEALVSVLLRVLNEPACAEDAQRHATAHLAKFRLAAVGSAYLEIFREELR